MPKEYRQHVFKPPQGATDFLLIRHGESQPAIADQPFPMKDGHGDPELHPNGHLQAKAVAERLKLHPINTIYATTLQRTHQTAAPLAKVLGLVPKTEPDLREVCLGEWDGGLYRIKAAERDPIFLKSMQMQEWGIIPGAETNNQVKARVTAGLQRIAAAHPDELVAVVVHGGVIAAILSVATGAKAFAFMGASNGSISRIVMDKDRIIVRGFNDTNHLD
jgi:probable phosphoglycerate mutase